MLIIFTMLILAVILVNGWTDAPNAISSCISTRSMTPKGALALAAVCNFCGCIGMAMISNSVASTVFGIVNLPDSYESALPTLCAGMCAVVIWSVSAWLFGIPTSESHALLAGITGAVLASNLTLSSVNLSEWLTVAYGLFLSTIPSFILARLIYSLMLKLLQNCERRQTMRYFMRAQRASAAWSALLHGAQDSQKFIGVFMLGLSVLNSQTTEDNFSVPLYVVIGCAAVMTLGTLIGGGRIIKKVGLDMVKLDAAGGTAADMSSSAVIFLCSLVGIPVSTTHTKSCAMMGVGSQKHGGGTDKRVVHQMLWAWMLTFPICGAIGFILSYVISLLS